MIAEHSNVEVKDDILSFTPIYQDNSLLFIWNFLNKYQLQSSNIPCLECNEYFTSYFLPLALLLHWHTMLCTSRTVISGKESPGKGLTWRRDFTVFSLVPQSIFGFLCRVLCIWRNVRHQNEHLTYHGFN